MAVLVDVTTWPVEGRRRHHRDHHHCRHHHLPSSSCWRRSTCQDGTVRVGVGGGTIPYRTRNVPGVRPEYRP